MKRSMLLAVILLLFVSSLFAVKGTGTASFAPSTGVGGATNKTFTWTYSAPVAFAYGYISITVPAGWTSATYDLTAAGACSITATNGTVLSTSVTASNIEIYVKALTANTGIIKVIYGYRGSGGPGVTNSSTPGYSYFGVYTDSAGMTPNAATSIVASKIYITAPTATITRTVTKTITKTSTPTRTPTYTKTATNTITGTVTKTITATNTPVHSLTFTKTITETPTDTVTKTITETLTNTFTKTATETITETSTSSVTATITKTATSTITPTVTITSTPGGYVVSTDANGRAYGTADFMNYSVPESMVWLYFDAGKAITITAVPGYKTFIEGIFMTSSHGADFWMEGSVNTTELHFDPTIYGPIPIKWMYAENENVYFYTETASTSACGVITYRQQRNLKP